MTMPEGEKDRLMGRPVVADGSVVDELHSESCMYRFEDECLEGAEEYGLEVCRRSLGAGPIEGDGLCHALLSSLIDDKEPSGTAAWKQR